MKVKYDLSKAKSAKKRRGLKVQKSFRLDPEVLLWLEEQGEKQGMGYQTFLNWYLNRQIAEEKTTSERLAALEAEIFKKKRA
ncbi:MAG: hypothetical protein COT74_02970 [Bdellovibrionales bacterium CG10_big_fil_rev_8_21_14_0_10_45_34]|nr:MAG: hypothetical protein COT74_02970 [Bdellovibrionales bacterium CG10_big_fil_rev_8_21_14_0_10_45_34]